MKTVTAETRMIAITQLRVAPWNARKTFDLETMASLTESIKLHGVQVPLIVRPLDVMRDIMSHPEAAAKGGQAYEIVAGHRRFKAAAILKLAELPCIVRELDDAAAREIGLIDNLQREDIPAMEEAEAFGELLDRLLSIAAVASRVGKEQSYVAKRLKLRTCTDHTRRALAAQLISIDHALLLARLGEDEQNQALKWVLDRNAGVKVAVEKVIEDRIARRKDAGEDDDLPEDLGEEAEDDPDQEEIAEPAKPVAAQRPHFRRGWEAESVLRLKEHIECETGTPLDRAPWRLEDGGETLVGDFPACVDCPQNTKANAPLFGDLDMGVAVCTDGGCFKAKTGAFVILQQKAAGEKISRPASEVLRVSWKATSTAPRLDKETGVPTLTQVFKDGQWEEATKKCEHVRTAVTVDWRDASGFGNSRTKARKPGEAVKACIEPKCKVHPKDWTKPRAKQSSNGNRYDAAAEEAKRAKLKAAAIEESKIRHAVAAKALEGVKALPEAALRAVVLGALPNWAERLRVCEALLPGLKKVIQTAKTGSVEFARAVALASLDFDKVSADEWRAVGEGRKEFLADVKRIGYDGSGAWLTPKPEKPVVEKAASKAPAKKAAAKTAPKKPAAKKAAKKGGKR